MARTVLGVVVGLVVLVVLLNLGLFAGMAVLGVESAFRPQAYEVSTVWAVSSLLVGLAAAMVGGWVCGRLAMAHRGPKVMAGLVVLLGAITIGVEVSKPVPPKREPGLDVAKAADRDLLMQNTRTPLWVNLANVAVGAAGVLVGGGAGARPRRGV